MTRTLPEELRHWEGEYHFPAGLLNRAADAIENLEARYRDLLVIAVNDRKKAEAILERLKCEVNRLDGKEDLLRDEVLRCRDLMSRVHILAKEKAEDRDDDNAAHFLADDILEVLEQP